MSSPPPAGSPPDGQTIRRLTLASLVLLVPGIALLSVATLGPSVGICTMFPCAYLSTYIGLVQAVLGLVPAAVALVLGLVAMARAKHWGWFVGLILPVVAAVGVSITASFGGFFSSFSPLAPGGPQFWLLAGAYALTPLAVLIVSVAGPQRHPPRTPA